MWLIRILSGPQAGQVIPLQEGLNVLGRSQNCDITIVSPSVSKQHAQIEVKNSNLIITDMGSRNGTFVNGVQIRKTSLSPHDKVALNDVILELEEGNASMIGRYPNGPPAYASPAPASPAMDGNVAYDLHAQHYTQQSGEPAQNISHGLQGFRDVAKNYIDEVILPGVYRLPELLEFKWVLGLFMAGFIVLVTSLSTIPLLQILKASVERESQEHALTIAKTLAEVNASPVAEGLNTAVSVAIALKRPGVSGAMIISDVDGTIIAPASKAGSYPDIPFVHEARKKGEEAVSQIDGDTVIAMVPMEFYNPQTGSRAITAYSVVIYDMASLAVDDGKTLSLFIQTLCIALLIGGILFFFLYKMIEFPIRSINAQLNEALKNGTDQVQVTYQFDALREMASNISSALSRTGSDSNGLASSVPFEVDRTYEMQNIVELVGFGAIAINALDRMISAINPTFEELTRLPLADALNTSIDNISDQALKLSIVDLIERLEQTPDQVIYNELEFNGDNYQLAAQTVQGASTIAYFLVVLLPADTGGGDYE